MTCEINFNEYIDLIPNDTINVIKKKRKYEINESVIKFINDLLLLNSKKPHKIKHINNLEGIEFRNDLRSKETVDTYIKNEKNLTKYFDKDTLRYYRKKKNENFVVCALRGILKTYNLNIKKNSMMKKIDGNTYEKITYYKIIKN